MGRQIRNEAGMARVPYFCSGCPHNSSTKVPEGSMAMAGIGCHTLAIGMERNTKTFTHMGAEGATWVGAAHFTDMPHVFQNLGDGTYFHSGYLAIRHAIATNTNITYKILYNDAVAMTGGQPHDGNVHPWTISQQVHAEGARRIALVSDDPDKYAIGTEWAPGVTFHHRDELDEVQRELREYKGVSILIYDQTCAAEKRRRRKRGTYPDPNKRVFINQAVCEGCGDCSVASNCLSVTPVETELGTKRAIDQSSCNKDYSCLNGFCPSFVTVEGGSLRKGKAAAAKTADRPAESPLPAAPVLPSVEQPYGVLITGIGGTGVVTIGAIMGMAAHIEGKGATVLDQLGMAQKGGAVDQPCPHRRQRPRRCTPCAWAPAAPTCCSAATSSSAPAPTRSPSSSPAPRSAIVNTHETITGEFTRHPDLAFPSNTLKLSIEAAAGADACDFLEASQACDGADGRFDRHQSLHAGLRLPEGPGPDRPRRARAGDRAQRHGRADESAAPSAGAAARPPTAPRSRRWSRRRSTMSSPLRSRPDRSTKSSPAGSSTSPAYQNAALAERYRALVERVRTVEQKAMPGADGARRSGGALLRQAARLQGRVRGGAALHRGGLRRPAQRPVRRRLPAEVPPRPAAAGFARCQDRTFAEAGIRPLDAAGLPLPGQAQGPARHRVRSVRLHRRAQAGARADPRVRGPGRRAIGGSRPLNHSLAVKLASIPDDIRGYGHVKDAHLDKARRKQQDLLAQWRHPPVITQAAE